MFQAVERHRDAQKALTAQTLRIKALRLNDENVPEVPVEFKVRGFWERTSKKLGHGVMFNRTSYQSDNEVAMACQWENGAMLHPHVHPDADEFIYVIRGSLKDIHTGAVLLPGEEVSVEQIMEGNAHSQPYVIPAGQIHFLQALERDTFFVVKLKKANVNSDNDQ